jgi:hypothetical protein
MSKEEILGVVIIMISFAIIAMLFLSSIFNFDFGLIWLGIFVTLLVLVDELK